MFCAGVCEGVDPAYVGVWVCGWVDEYPGFPDAVEDDLGHGKGDGWESCTGKAIMWKEVEKG